MSGKRAEFINISQFNENLTWVRFCVCLSAFMCVLGGDCLHPNQMLSTAKKNRALVHQFLCVKFGFLIYYLVC